MPDAGKKIQLTWDYFESEPGYDFITIYDGPDASYPILYGPASGTLNIPSFISTDPSGALTVFFTADEAVHGRGWKATVSCWSDCPEPGAAGSISGPAKVCVNKTGFVYTVDAITHATSYVWTLPAGMSPVTGGLTTANNSITVKTNGSYSGGSITVHGMNNCGDGLASPVFAVSILTSAPSIPTAINGLTEDVYGYCGGGTYILTTTSVNAETFYWTASAGTIQSGQGTNTVSIVLNNSYSSCKVSVKASNCAGSSEQRKLTLKSVLSTPKISGVSAVCNNSDPIKTYSISSDGGASSYTWSSSSSTIKFSDGGVPANPLTSTSNHVTVNFSTVAVGTYSIGVTANNSCGSSAPSSMSTKVKNCNKSEETAIAAGEESNFTIYPNPTNDLISVTFISDVAGKYTVKISDMNGKVVIQEEMNAIIGNNEYKCHLGNFAPGLYSLNIQTGTATFQTRIIKQ